MSLSALGLHTDLYELRMAETCLRTGMVADATFSLFVRPDAQRPWFVAAGIERALEVIEGFTYSSAELTYLREQGLSDELLGWLAGLEPAGEVWAVDEGTLLLGDEPLLEVTAPLPQAMLLETAVMNVVHLSTLLATKAARYVLAADGAGLADFGFRRAHGLEAGIEAARAAYIGGVDSTSTVEAGRRFGIPVSGTMAHSFIQAVGDEAAAFADFAHDHPENTILLVDTYDTLEGVRRAIAVGHDLRARGADLVGIRLDSGDLDSLARSARSLLDEAGFEQTRIVASGGLDEHRVAALVGAGAPIDAYGIGTALVTSSDRPSIDIVYKLVTYDGTPRAKYSVAKATLPGRKQIHRFDDPADDVLALRDEGGVGGRSLLRPVWRDGRRLLDFDLGRARAAVAAGLASLPAAWRGLGPVETPPRPHISPELGRCAERLRATDLASGPVG